MGVKLYDDAIVSKFKQWTQRTNIHIYSPSETKRIFEIIAEQTNDKPIGLPFIGLSRVGGYTILLARNFGVLSHSRCGRCKTYKGKCNH